MFEVTGEQPVVRTDRRGRVCVLSVRGPLGGAAAAGLAERVAAERATRAARLVIDMSGVSSVDFSAARALAAAAAPVPGQCPLIVRGCRPAVRGQLELAGLAVGRPGGEAGPAAGRAGGRDGLPPGRATSALIRTWQHLHGSAEQAIADSRRVAQSLASTEEQVAATLQRLAAQRPAAAARLERLSREARDYAATLRDRRSHETGSPSPGPGGVKP